MEFIDSIRRHQTAISRTELSRPLRLALDNGIIPVGSTLFDYGCGKGDDVAFLGNAGINAAGWDPVHRPHERLVECDAVNLGYVVNVIEAPGERAETLRKAWNLCRRVLIVSARLEYETDGEKFRPFGDGFVTARGTFQKLYTQLELREWIEGVLKERPLAAAPGVFFVFRDAMLRDRVLDSRYRHTRAAPEPRISDVLFDRHREILSKLMEFVVQRGRIPQPDELSVSTQLEQTFGSLRKAFAVVRRVTGAERWEQICQDRRDDLLIRFALDRFGKRHRFSHLSRELQSDVRALFSTYSKACAASDELLSRAGNMSLLDQAMRQSGVGKLTPAALYIHVDARPLLPVLLRVYEGCARCYLGHVDGANIIKLSREFPKVSYLFYPDFDTDAHPALRESLRLRLSNADVKHMNFRDSENPPILHRKEEFVASTDPRREVFASLTQQEERLGLFEDTTRIGTRAGWNQLLASRGLRIEGHTIISDG